MESRLFLGIGVMVASGALGLSAFQNSLVPYVSFPEAQAAGRSVQVSGEVVRAKVQYDAKTGTLIFPLKDHKGETMTVVSHDGKPNNFDQAPQVVAIGRVEEGVFQAESLLTKCPSKYEAEEGAAYAPKGGYAPKGDGELDKSLEAFGKTAPKSANPAGGN